MVVAEPPVFRIEKPMESPVTPPTVTVGNAYDEGEMVKAAGVGTTPVPERVA
jgi:hypothetical protein